MPINVKYRARYNRHGSLNLEKRFTVFGYEVWVPFAWNLTLYAAQRIMERRKKNPIYFTDDGLTIPDIW